MNRLLFILLVISAAFPSYSQVQLLGAIPDQTSGKIDILKWSADDSNSLVRIPTSLEAYYATSSMFNSFNSTYYLGGYGSDGEGLLAFNSLSGEQSMLEFNSQTYIADVDMSTGMFYSLEFDEENHILVKKHDPASSTAEILGIIDEPGMNGLVTDATGFDSNEGILYHAGYDGSSTLCLFSIPVRDSVFSYSKIALNTGSAPGYINCLHFDHVKNKLYALNNNGATNTYSLAEIDCSGGMVMNLAELTGITGFVMGSSAYDQYSGTFILAVVDQDFELRLLMFNTNDLSISFGYLPELVSEIVCDNYSFARSTYQVTSLSEPGLTGLQIFPNPANDRLMINSNSPGTGKTVFRLTDQLGRTRLNETREWMNIQELDISGIPVGCYYLSIETGGHTLSQKVVILP